MADPRYRLNVDFDNTITPFQYNGTGSYTFTVPATPNHLGTRYVVFLPAVLYLKDSDKLPAISGYTRIENAIPGAGEFRTIASANYDTLLLKDSIEFPASSAGATLTMTNFWTIGSTVEPDVTSQILAITTKLNRKTLCEEYPPLLTPVAMPFTSALYSSRTFSTVLWDGNQTLVAAMQAETTGNILYSIDNGVTWVNTGLGVGMSWAGGIHCNGYFYLCAFAAHPSGQCLYRSSNGIDWTWVNTPTPTGKPATSQGWGRIVFIDDVFVMLCIGGCTDGNPIARSYDGTTWSMITSGTLTPRAPHVLGDLHVIKEDNVLIVTQGINTSDTAGRYLFYISKDKGLNWLPRIYYADSSGQNAFTLIKYKNGYRGYKYNGVMFNLNSIDSDYMSAQTPFSTTDTYLYHSSISQSHVWYSSIVRVGTWYLCLVTNQSSPKNNLLLTKDFCSFHQIGLSDPGVLAQNTSSGNLGAFINMIRSYGSIFLATQGGTIDLTRRLFRIDIPQEYLQYEVDEGLV